MKTTLLAVLLASATAAGFGLSPQDPQDPFAPGPQHAMLAKTAGTWKAVAFLPNEKGEEQKIEGSLVRRAQSGLHLIDDYTGPFMGKDFTGHGIHGYCPIQKKFYTFWVDSMLPSPMTTYGDYDEKKKELVQIGEAVGRSGKFEKCRTVTNFQDDDHWQWAMYGPGPDGKEGRHLRIEYTRKK